MKFLKTIFGFLLGKKRIPLHARPRIRSLVKHIETIDDPAKKVLEADKVLHEALKSFGSNASLGDLLKRYGSKLPNEQPVWNAHKLRNRIAHEPQVTVSATDADRAVNALLKATTSLL
jgi:dephospho-CoA kinase